MSPREVCFILGADDAVLWSDASDSPVALPDSRARWEAIWSRREAIVEIAHTHPLGGAAFSNEDKTTMEALDSALGRRLIYSVVTPSAMLRRTPGDGDALVEGLVGVEPWWTALIRAASGVEGQPRALEGEGTGGAVARGDGASPSPADISSRSEDIE